MLESIQHITCEQDLGQEVLLLDGQILEIGASLVTNKKIPLFNTHRVDVKNEVLFTSEGSFLGQGSLLKIGKGTLVLVGTHLHRGGTKIQEGTCLLNGDLSESGPITVSQGAKATIPRHTGDRTFNGLFGEGELELNDNLLTVKGSGNFLGNISGQKGLRKIGEGTLSLLGESQYIGSTSIEGGALCIAHEIALGHSKQAIQFKKGALQVTQSMRLTRNLSIEEWGELDVPLGQRLEVDSYVLGNNGRLIKTGAGTLLLNKNNTYSGGTRVAEGFIELHHECQLGRGAIQLAGGGIENKDQDLIITKDINIETTGEIRANNKRTLQIKGNVSGNGTLVKTGSGTVFLTGQNNYEGETHILEGTLVGSTTSLTGDILNQGSLHMLQEKDGVYQGNIQGEGTFVKRGVGSLQLKGVGSEKGKILVKQGMLRGSTLNLIGQIENDDCICFLQTEKGVFNGKISGSGSLIKEGEGQLTLNHENTYKGETSLCEGSLVVNGAIREVVLYPNTRLSGRGILGKTQNFGTIAPGNSIGVLSITGDYTQFSEGSLEIEIDALGQHDRLIISGDAHLDGKLQILPEIGQYRKGMTYTFLTADSINGSFTELESSFPSVFSLQYGLDSVQISLRNSLNILPVPISDLRGNSRVIADYLFGNNYAAADADLSHALQQLLNLPAPFFAKGLMKVSPLQFGALPIVNLQNDIRMSQAMNHEFKRICACLIKKPEKKRMRLIKRLLRRVEKKKSAHLPNCIPMHRQGFWMEPIGYYYNQHSRQGRLTDVGQPAFTAYTYGTSLGWSRLFRQHWIFNAATGYTHTNIFWENRLGDGNWNTLYISPSIGWVNNQTFVNILVLTSFNFYKMNRNIHYGQINRKASNQHNSYDFLAQLSGGSRFKLRKSFFYLQPEGQFNSLNIFEKGYVESGADGLNLHVRNKSTTYFQPNLICRLIREYFFRKGCFSPNIFIGWLANIPVSNGKYTATLAKESTQRQRFSVLTYNETTNQMTLGFELPFQSYNSFSFKIGYEANFLSLYQIHQATCQLNWDF